MLFVADFYYRYSRVSTWYSLTLCNLGYYTKSLVCYNKAQNFLCACLTLR